MVITDEKKRSIFDEIAKVLETPRQAEDEITTKEYAELASCTMREAYGQLMKAVAIEKMTKRKVLVGSHWVWAFKLVKNEEIG